MFNKSDYLEDSQRTALISATQRVREIVRYVVENKDAFEEELKMLTRLNKENPNKIFPIKIDNIIDGCNCFETLNTWYNVRV